MAAKEISVKKYVVRLSGEERERLETLIRKGKSPAQRLLKARILLKADVSEGGDGWSDSEITKALETSPSMVHRARKQLVEGLAGKGWVGAAFEAYAHGANVPMSGLEASFTSYLRTAPCALDPALPLGRRVLDARRALLVSLSR